MKKVSYLGHRWYVLPEKSSLGSDYLVFRRVSFLSELKRTGNVSTVIDVDKSNFHLVKGL